MGALIQQKLVICIELFFCKYLNLVSKILKINLCRKVYHWYFNSSYVLYERIFWVLWKFSNNHFLVFHL